MHIGRVTLSYNAAMGERYRLVFRGEVLDGQHRVVVKRRLMESLKLSDAQLDKLFSGNAVVLKRDVDVKVAARYQSLFKQAGARLRVLAQDRVDAPDRSSAGEEPTCVVAADDRAASRRAAMPADGTSPAAAALSDEFTLVDNTQLDELVAAAASVSRVEINAPAYSIAELGVDLGVARPVEPTVLPDLDLTLAEVGADLLDDTPGLPEVELGPLDFELAEVGAVLGDASPRPVPPPPDTSHIALVEEA